MYKTEFIKKLISAVYVLSLGLTISSQSVDSTGNPDSLALIRLKEKSASTFFPIASTETANQITAVKPGSVIFNSDSNCLCVFIDTVWINLCSNQNANDSNAIRISGGNGQITYHGSGGLLVIVDSTAFLDNVKLIQMPAELFMQPGCFVYYLESDSLAGDLQQSGIIKTDVYDAIPSINGDRIHFFLTRGEFMEDSIHWANETSSLRRDTVLLSRGGFIEITVNEPEIDDNAVAELNRQRLSEEKKKPKQESENETIFVASRLEAVKNDTIFLGSRQAIQPKKELSGVAVNDKLKNQESGKTTLNPEQEVPVSNSSASSHVPPVSGSPEASNQTQVMPVEKTADVFTKAEKTPVQNSQPEVNTPNEHPGSGGELSDRKKQNVLTESNQNTTTKTKIPQRSEYLVLKLLIAVMSLGIVVLAVQVYKKRTGIKVPVANEAVNKVKIPDQEDSRQSNNTNGFGTQNAGLAAAVFPSVKLQGHEFELFMIQLINRSSDRFNLIEWNSLKKSRSGEVVFPKGPDLIYEYTDEIGPYSFAIECKWRDEFKNGEIKWASQNQIQHYREYEEKNNRKVFVAIGLGSNPSQPETLYISTLQNLQNSPHTTEESLRKFKHNPRQKFFFEQEGELMNEF